MKVLTHQMVIVTLVPEEFPVTQFTNGGGSRKLSTFQRSFGFEEVVAVLTFTGGAPFTIAAMISEVFMVVSSVTVMRFAEESTEGVASVVMVIFFNETNDLTQRCGRVSSKNDHVWQIDGHYFNLVLGQGSLKSLDFWNTTRSFGNSCW